MDGGLQKFSTEESLQAFLSQPEPAGMITRHDQLTGEVAALIDQIHVRLTALKALDAEIYQLQAHEARAVIAAVQNSTINAGTAHGRLESLAAAAGVDYSSWASERTSGVVSR